MHCHFDYACSAWYSGLTAKQAAGDVKSYFLVCIKCVSSSSSNMLSFEFLFFLCRQIRKSNHIFADVWSQSKVLVKLKILPAVGTTWNVSGSNTSIGIVVWAPWISVQKFMTIYAVTLKTFLSKPKVVDGLMEQQTKQPILLPREPCCMVKT